MSVRELYNSLVSDPDDGGTKKSRDTENNIIISDSTFCSLLPHQQKKSAWYKVMCGCECYISAKSIHDSLLPWCDWYSKSSKIKAKMLKIEGLEKKKIAYMKHKKIQWCHMGVIFMPNHLIWQRQKCVHIHRHIMHQHTGNVHCNVLPNVHVLIFLTKKQVISIPKKPLQFVFIFIIWLCFLRHMEILR